MALLISHSVRFCARSQSIFKYLKSLSTTWYQVFRVLSFLCYPSTTISLHFFIKLSSLHLSTRPKHLNLLLLMQFLMLSKPKRSLSSEEGFQSFKVTLQIHLIILVSLHFNLNKSDSFSLKYNINKCMHKQISTQLQKQDLCMVNLPMYTNFQAFLVISDTFNR